jgi:hypothetical protein
MAPIVKDSADYMSMYVPEGEETARLSPIESLKVTVLILLTGFAGRGDLLMHVVLLVNSTGVVDFPVLSDVRDFLRATPMACVLLLVVSAAFTSLLYYNHCSKMEAEYYTRPKEESHKWKIQSEKWLAPERHREEVMLGCFNAALGAVLANCLALAYLLWGKTAIYVQVEDYGLIWFFASFPVIFLWIEVWAYCSHRFWHLKVSTIFLSY